MSTFYVLDNDPLDQELGQVMFNKELNRLFVAVAVRQVTNDPQKEEQLVLKDEAEFLLLLSDGDLFLDFLKDLQRRTTDQIY